MVLNPQLFGSAGPAYQQTLFDADEVEKQNRVALGAKRLLSGKKPVVELRDRALGMSTIPTSHLQSRPSVSGRSGETERPDTRMWHGSGMYQPQKNLLSLAGTDPNTGKKVYNTELESDVVTFPAKSGGSRTPGTVMMHELGHRHHFGAFPTPTDRDVRPQSEGVADPLLEGHADAYVDRYYKVSGEAAKDRTLPGAFPRGVHPGSAQKATKYNDINFTGYTPSFVGDSRRGKSWTDAQSALYSAVRAHHAQTGEIVEYARGAERAPQEQAYDRRNDVPTPADRYDQPTTDATLHNLITTSPHARQAVDETHKESKVGQQNLELPLGPIADAASRRHLDRRLLQEGQFIQEDLFGDPEMSYNQHREKPRTVADVQTSLRIKKGALDTDKRGLL